jgi:TctA family transporter
MAILVGALLVHGVQPGPLLISEHPDILGNHCEHVHG